MWRRWSLPCGLACLLWCTGCQRQAVPEVNAEAAPVPATTEPPAGPEPFADPLMGVAAELPVGWTGASGDEPATLRFQKAGNDQLTVEVQLMAPAEYLEIQKVLEVEQQPAAARVKAVAAELQSGLTEPLGAAADESAGTTATAGPEIVSDDVWERPGILSGRQVIATDGSGAAAAQGAMIVAEALDSSLYIIYCHNQGQDDRGWAEAKQLLSSLKFSTPETAAIATPTPSAGDSLSGAAGVDAGGTGVDAGVAGAAGAAGVEAGATGASGAVGAAGQGGDATP